MNNKSLYFFICLFSILASCQKQKTKTTTTKKYKKKEINESLNFNYLKTKSKVNYDDGEQKMGGTAHIRIKKDQKIWVSVTAGFGFEAARCLINKDSLFLMDKVNKEFQGISLSQLSKKTQFNLDFYTIQAFLLGNLPFKQDMEQRIDSTAKNLVLTQNDKFNDYKVLINPDSHKIEKIKINNKINGNHLQANYDQFHDIKKLRIPYSNQIEATFYKKNNKRNIKLSFQHKNVEVVNNKLNFPFNIPENYKR